MADNPTFQIPKDVIEPIIQAHIAAAVTAALSGQDQLMNKAVHMVLNQKVDSNGKPDSYPSSSSITFIQWAMREALQKATKDALVAEVAKHADVIRANIAAQLKNSKSPIVQKLVEGLVGALVNPDTLKYRLTITATD
jgi:hypothetical protein